MKISSWQTNVTSQIATQAKRNGWSRQRTLISAASVLLLLYVGLLFALPDDAQAAPPSALPALSVAPQAAPTQTPTDGAGDTPPADGGVSPVLLAEFDRLAGNQGESVRQESSEESQSTPSMVSTLFFYLVLIVATIYGGVWLYKRYTMSANPGGLLVGGRLLAIQESQSIGPNQKLHLVRMGNELLLIGATEQNISFLARYDGDVANDSFAEHLQSAITPDGGQSSAGMDMGDRLRQLRNLNQSGFRGGSNG